MSKRIVGYIVSHTGKRGGPWEGIGDPYGSQAIKARYRAVWHTAFAARARLPEIQRIHPAARILRLVRRERDVFAVPTRVRDGGWQWRPVQHDSAFAPPFGTIRMCDCGALVGGGPSQCTRCASDETSELAARLADDIDTREERAVVCPVHAHQIHGGEAEELRRGIEGLIAQSVKAWDACGEPFDCVTETNLQRLVDSVDARDSLAHLETNRAEERAVVEAAMANSDEYTKAEAERMGPAFYRQWLACAALRAKRGG